MSADATTEPELPPGVSFEFDPAIPGAVIIVKGTQEAARAYIAATMSAIKVIELAEAARKLHAKATAALAAAAAKQVVMHDVSIEIGEDLTARLQVPAANADAAREWGITAQLELERLVDAAASAKSKPFTAYGRVPDARWLGFEGK